MMKGLKIATLSVGTILVFMFLLPFAFQGKIANLVKQEGNKALNATFDFEELNISLFRNFPQASITLKNFWLKGADEFTNDTLVQAEEITAAVNLLSLLGENGLEISKILIDNTQVHTRVLPDGKNNWNLVKSETADNTDTTTPTTENSAFKIKLKQFTIDHLNLIHDDQQQKMYTEIRNFSGKCSGDFSSDHTTLQLKIETEALTYKMNNIPFLSNANIGAQMDIDADLANYKFTLKNNHIRLNAIEAGINGWLAVNNPAIEMDLKLQTNDISFKEILSLIPAIYTTEFSSLQTNGLATLSASAQGTLQGDTVPNFHLNMHVKDAMFRYPSLPAGVDQINLNAEIQNPGGHIDRTTISIQPLSFSIAGNPFSMNTYIQTPISDLDFTAEAKGILNLGMIQQVYPLKDLEFNGTFHADMQLAGRMSYINQEKYDLIKAAGTLGVNNLSLKTETLPDIHIQKSLFTFTPKYLQLSETTATIGENDITADSRFENYIGYALKGSTLKGNLNIRSNHFNLNDFMTSSTGTDSVTSSTDTLTTATGIIEVPQNIHFHMNAHFQKVLLGKMTFQHMNGQLAIKDSKIDMKNLSANTMNGNVIMNGFYSTAHPQKPILNGKFQLNNIGFAQAYKELDMIQKMAPIFENLKGKFSGNIQVETQLDSTMSPVLESMQGEGNLSTQDLSLSGVKAIDQIADAIKRPDLKNMQVKDMNLHFLIQDGRVLTDPFNIQMGKYNLTLSGSTGLDQSIAYTGKIKLPASTGNLSELTTLDLKIGGSFTSPQVSVDTQSMINQALGNVTNQALDKLGEKLGIDSTTRANKDSLKQQLKEKAGEKILNLFKKKQK